MKTALTPRERTELALQHQPTDRVPVSLIGSYINPPARKELNEYLLATQGIDVDTYLKPIIDVVAVAPRYIGPSLSAGTDIWGVHRSQQQAGLDIYDEIDNYPLADVTDLNELRNFRWPESGWFDFTVIPEQIAAIRTTGDYAIWYYGSGNIFETTWYMRGFERTFMDFYDNPELAHAILQRVTDFYIDNYRKALEAADGEILLAFTGDDIAGQQGLLISLDSWKEFIQPYHQRLNAAIHEFGCKVIYHSDGAVMNAVPGLIDMGIDVLESLQFDAADMDPTLLKSLYGEKLSFAGGVSVQHTLPFGTTDDVQREVEHLINTLGKQGGYILGPSHSIQGGTPPENIVAMFDTAVGIPLGTNLLY
jgi:uroporphyrinogen decarboxylase